MGKIVDFGKERSQVGESRQAPGERPQSAIADATIETSVAHLLPKKFACPPKFAKTIAK